MKNIPPIGVLMNLRIAPDLIIVCPNCSGRAFIVQFGKSQKYFGIPYGKCLLCGYVAFRDEIQRLIEQNFGD